MTTPERPRAQDGRATGADRVMPERWRGDPGAQWRMVRALVDAALELPAPERAAFLERAGADALVRSEAARWLAACERADRSVEFLAAAAERAAPLLDVDALPDTRAPAPDDAPTLARLRRALAPTHEVVREIGRGGMATVYLARDLKHERVLALKVLHGEWGAAVGRSRFLAEIRVTARLQHPHLLPLLDSGEVEGQLYYTMPYVDGGSLRARLTREGRLPVGDAVRTAMAVASALDYAHRHGVVHRDLKPENILLHEGEPLVADFGIALAVAGATTHGERLTHTGVSLGTPGYMSPEQATGERDVDARADVWALGCVLHEMLAGSAPFAAPSAPAVLARVLSEAPPPLRAVRPDVPAHVAAAVRTALEKEPADRFATAAAFADALGGARSTAPSRGSSSLRSATRRRLRAHGAHVLAWTAGAVVLLGLGTMTWMRSRSSRAPTTGPTRFALTLPPGEHLTWVVRRSIAIAPDGRTVAFVSADSAGTDRLHVRRLDEERPRVLPGTEGAEQPFFSPDGQWIGYFGPQGDLFRLPARGGAPVPVRVRANRAGASWGPRGVIVLGMGKRADGTVIPGLALVSADNGSVRPLTTPDTARGEILHHYPLVLGDGETVLFTSVPREAAEGQAGGYIGIASLSSGTHTVLDLPGRYPLGVADGRLLYAGTDGMLMAVPLDLRRRRVTGTPAPVDSGPMVPRTGDSFAVLAASGTLAYARRVPVARAVLVGSGGLPVVRLAELGEREFYSPRFSPDGRRIALSIGRVGPASTLWVYDTASRALSRLARSHSLAWDPVWTPDGASVVFVSMGLGIEQRGLWRQPVEEGGPPELLVSEHGGMLQGGAVSPDGRKLLYAWAPKAADLDLRTAALTPGATPRTWLGTPANELMPEFSPDGRWVAYMSNETGRYEVYVRLFEGTGAGVRVSTDGGTEPCWSPDGRRLFYRSGRRMLAAQIATTPSLVVTAREVLFEGDYRTSLKSRNFDVAPNGRQFVMLQPVGDESDQVVIAVDWLDQLRARLRAARSSVRRP